MFMVQRRRKAGALVDDEMRLDRLESWCADMDEKLARIMVTLGAMGTVASQIVDRTHDL